MPEENKFEPVGEGTAYQNKIGSEVALFKGKDGDWILSFKHGERKTQNIIRLSHWAAQATAMLLVSKFGNKNTTDKSA